jgi:gliding motility-associated-like protein
MIRLANILAVISLVLLPVYNTCAQPVWVKGTPSVVTTGALTITLNHGIDRTGRVYIIVYNYNNTSTLTSSAVRTRAILGPSGTVTATAVVSVKREDVDKVLQVVLNVIDPGQIHTIYIVAADSKNRLQSSPVRLNATTLPCPEADAGSGGNECDRNFILNAVPALGTGVWTRVSGPGNATFSPNASTPTATVSVSVYGSYTFRWTETRGGCKSSDDIIVNFYQPPVANSGTGGNQCGLAFTLRAVTGSSEVNGTWTMTSGEGTATFSPDTHSPAATVTVSEYGTKVFTWTVTNGPCSASSNVTVNFYQQPIANAGQGGNSCGLEFYLNAMPSAGTGTWTRVSGPGTVNFSPNNHAPDARATISTYGTYVFRWTEVNGPCTSNATVTVGFFEQISANAGNGGNECDRNFVLNAVPGSGTGTWTKLTGPGNATFSPNPNRYNATVAVTEWGDYDFAWTEVSNNCSSVDIIRVGFHAPPSIMAGPDVVICRGSRVRLQAAGSGTFLWSPGNLVDNPAAQNPLAAPVATTVFTVVLTDQYSCRNSDQVTVEVREKPLADAGKDQILNFQFAAELAASEIKSNETGEWVVLTGKGTIEDKNNNNTIVTDLSPGENKFLWSVTNGVCDLSSDTVVIRINELIIPTLITPNLDGNNDYFVVSGLESLGTSILYVFNRWGAMVYKNDDYANDWDGNDDNGNPLPDDTYFFLLKSEKITPIKGYIVIIR